MSCYSLTHVADQVLLRELAALNSQDQASIAALLARLAEVEGRKLYLLAAHPSMYDYCVHELHMSEDVALKRIRVARAAREFPALFPALANGRVNQTTVLLLKPCLTTDNVDDLLAAATHKTKAKVELMLAQRFPKPDVPTVIQPAPQLAPEPVGSCAPQLAPEPVDSFVLQLAPEPVGRSAHGRAKSTPLSPGKFAWQMTVNQHTQDQADYSRALLGHAVPSGAMEALVEQAFDALVEKLERRKFAKCTHSRPGRGSPKGRYIPAEVRRAVFQRDEGRCTFVSDKGKRCEATSRLEFDHVEAFAIGGQSTTKNMRLRCRGHNQYAADCAFGSRFMQTKREEARLRTAKAKALAEAATAVKTRAKAEAEAKAARQEEIVPWLRQLGYSVLDARRGAAFGADLPDASLEQRVRAALRGLAPHYARPVAPVALSSG